MAVQESRADPLERAIDQVLDAHQAASRAPVMDALGAAYLLIDSVADGGNGHPCLAIADEHLADVDEFDPCSEVSYHVRHAREMVRAVHGGEVDG